jgi:hypothetical protein
MPIALIYVMNISGRLTYGVLILPISIWNKPVLTPWIPGTRLPDQLGKDEIILLLIYRMCMRYDNCSA